MEPITRCLEDARKEKMFPGYTFALICDGKTKSISGGTATYDPESFVVTEKTRYDVASLTKIVGPMSVAMQLIDSDKLNLSDSVVKYIPEFSVGELKSDVTIAHLMTYTILYDIPDGAKEQLPNLTPEQIRHNVFSYNLKKVPGTHYQYSNLTAFILSQIIERVLNQPFEEVVYDRILEPLGMHATTFTPTPEQRKYIPPTEITEERGLVQGFVHDEFSYYLRPGSVGNGAAGLFSTIEDMATFLRMTLKKGVYDNGKLFSEEIVKLWTADYWPSLLPTRTPLGWGDFANDLIDQYHREIVIKGGFTGCFLAADLKNEVGFVLLSNRTFPKRPADGQRTTELRKKLMKICFGER